MNQNKRMKVIETKNDDETITITVFYDEPYEHPPIDNEHYDREKARQEAFQLAYEIYKN